MKKTLLLFLIGIFSLGMPAQVVNNFNCNDCNGNNHDLFTELDTGQVIIICWVMPCSACVPTATINSTVAQSFAISNPGKVKYYLCDDTGNNPCATINNFATSNGIATDATFSDSTIDWTDYGPPAMPKTVILGGMDHHIYYLFDGDVNNHDVTLAVQNALAETGISNQNQAVSEMNLFPNPATSETINLSYVLTQQEAITLEVYTAFGSKVKSVEIENGNPGKHEVALDLTGFCNGFYFLRLTTGTTAQTIKFVVAE